MDFGKQLQNLLDENDITQKFLADELGISASTLNGYIKNRRQPDPSMTTRIAKYFHTTTDYLYGITSIKEALTQSYSANEQLLITLYRKLPSSSKSLYIELGKTLLREVGKKARQ